MKFSEMIPIRKLLLTVVFSCLAAALLVLQSTSPPVTYLVPEELPTQPPLRTGLSPDELSQVKAAQAKRIALLERECSREHERGFSIRHPTMEEVAKRTSVVEKYNVSNCVVYKAGSSAWNGLLAHVLSRNDLIKTGEVYKIADILRPSKSRLQKVVASKDYIRFVVAREPLSRLLSAYRDRILDISHPSWQAHHFAPLILQYTRGNTYRSEDMFFPNGSVRIMPTFLEFARYVADSPTVSLDPHWKPVSLQCGLCIVNYTVVVHMESFLPDIRYILRESGMERDVDASLLVVNAHKGKGKTEDLLISNYSTLPPELLKKLLRLYSQDFRFFGYDPRYILEKIYPGRKDVLDSLMSVL
ncbi:carbohydrate sulfotransferase 14-like [Penaeus chinensis]|uniref:carbohydrate sulfotransferase 14-like n=1 Tax=Penaeus chinensis TaxID=139456 RepID=UPI001FB81B21|nr:carbohydrate sulfotransferase 14-like [Penaeus chinensis]